MRIPRSYRVALIFFGAALVGCQTGLGLLDPDFVELLRPGDPALSIPGDNPGLLVYVENRTDRAALMTISYRTDEDAVETYTTSLNPGDKSGQVLICPITEITLGNVSDLSEVGVRVAATPGVVGEGVDISQVPGIEVEPFGILLTSDRNYSCGDSLTFVVQPSSTSRSRFGTIVFRRIGEAAALTTDEE